MQSPKYGQNNVRVTPSNDRKRQKKSQQMEYDAVGYVIRELFVYRIVPTVLVHFNDPYHVTVAGVTIYRRHLMSQVVDTACVAAKPSQSRHVTSLSKPEDGAGQSKHYDPNHDASALDSLLSL